MRFWDTVKLTLVYLLTTVVVSAPTGLAYHLSDGGEVPQAIPGWLDTLVFWWTFVSTGELLLTSLLLMACFHLLVTVFGGSEGLFQSYIILVYGVGYYLGVFWLLGSVASFFGLVYVSLPPDIFVGWAAVSSVNDAALVVIQYSALFYTGYSLYLGAKIKHRADRLVALVAAAAPTLALGLLFSEVSGRWGGLIRDIATLLTETIG